MHPGNFMNTDCYHTVYTPTEGILNYEQNDNPAIVRDDEDNLSSNTEEIDGTALSTSV